jgi:hypothetical protein
MVVKENKVRKLVTLDAEMWQEIEDYRFAARHKSESDAIKSLLGLGLIKMREMLEALTPEEKGKRR